MVIFSEDVKIVNKKVLVRYGPIGDGIIADLIEAGLWFEEIPEHLSAIVSVHNINDFGVNQVIFNYYSELFDPSAGYNVHPSGEIGGSVFFTGHNGADLEFLLEKIGGNSEGDAEHIVVSKDGIQRIDICLKEGLVYGVGTNGTNHQVSFIDRLRQVDGLYKGTLREFLGQEGYYSVNQKP